MKPFKQNMTVAIDRRECLMGLSAVLCAGATPGIAADRANGLSQTSAIGGVLSFPAPSDASLYLQYYVANTSG